MYRGAGTVLSFAADIMSRAGSVMALTAHYMVQIPESWISVSVIILFLSIVAFEVVALWFYFDCPSIYGCGLRDLGLPDLAQWRFGYPKQYTKYKGVSLLLVALVQCFINMTRYGPEMMMRGVISASIMAYLLTTPFPTNVRNQATITRLHVFITACVVISNMSWAYTFSDFCFGSGDTISTDDDDDVSGSETDAARKSTMISTDKPNLSQEITRQPSNEIEEKQDEDDEDGADEAGIAHQFTRAVDMGNAFEVESVATVDQDSSDESSPEVIVERAQVE